MKIFRFIFFRLYLFSFLLFPISIKASNQETVDVLFMFSSDALNELNSGGYCKPPFAHTLIVRLNFEQKCFRP